MQSTAIDVHSHLMPEAAFARVPSGMSAVSGLGDDELGLYVDGRGERGRGAPRELRDIRAHRERQASRGVDVSIVGPWIDMIKAPTDELLQHRWCTVVNEELAQATNAVAHSHFLAALCDLDGGRAADNLESAVQAGAVGGMLAANPEVGTLARADFDALWATAERLGVPIVLHPGEFSAPDRLREHFMVNLVGNPFETTLAVGTLLASGVPDRFPHLKLVLVHGGGFYPYQFGRLDAGFARWLGFAGGADRPARDHLSWFYYDTVLFDDEPTRYLLELVGDDRVMAGSDCPFRMSDHRPFEVPAALGLDPAALTRVRGGTAGGLFSLKGVE